MAGRLALEVHVDVLLDEALGEGREGEHRGAEWRWCGLRLGLNGCDCELRTSSSWGGLCGDRYRHGDARGGPLGGARLRLGDVGHRLGGARRGLGGACDGALFDARR